MRNISLLSAGLLFLACLEITSTTYGSENEENKMNEFVEVILEDAVKEFKYVVTIACHHNLEEPEEAYPRPHLHVTTHYACMRSAGWKDVDFETVMTVSGAGLLFVYDPRFWEVKRAVLTIGAEDRIAEAFGFGWEWLHFDNADDAWRIIKDTIDSGRPAKGLLGEGNLFVGYRDAPRKEDRQVRLMGDPFPGSDVWWTWKEFDEWAQRYVELRHHIPGHALNRIGRHTSRTRKADERSTALGILKDAVAWSRTPPESAKTSLHEVTNAVFGLAAIQAFAEDIGDVAGKPKDYFDSAWRGCHAINQQWTARNSTAVYLEHVVDAQTFRRDASEHLAEAAKQYKAAYGAWMEFDRQLSRDAWNAKKTRLAGAAAVRKALEHEKAAIDEMEKALSLIE